MTKRSKELAIKAFAIVFIIGMLVSSFSSILFLM